MNEHQFYQKFQDHMKGHGAHCQRIENTVGSGVPDINVCLLGMEAWAELKMIIPVGVLLRKEQYAWGMRRAQAGGTVVVIADDGDFFHCWKFPDVQVEAYGNSDKYVRIHSKPSETLETMLQVKKFLFPCI